MCTCKKDGAVNALQTHAKVQRPTLCNHYAEMHKQSLFALQIVSDLRTQQLGQVTDLLRTPLSNESVESSGSFHRCWMQTAANLGHYRCLCLCQNQCLRLCPCPCQDLRSSHCWANRISNAHLAFVPTMISPCCACICLVASHITYNEELSASDMALALDMAHPFSLEIWLSDRMMYWPAFATSISLEVAVSLVSWLSGLYASYQLSAGRQLCELEISFVS